MAKGRRWPAEWREYKDEETGVWVRQLTNYRGHSHHLYFTNPGWYDGGARLLFGSDREGMSNLFSIDLTDGSILQLTDLEMKPPARETSLLFSCVNPTRPEAYFWEGATLKALDLESLDERALYTCPAGYAPNIANCTADGRFICSVIYEDLSEKFQVDLLHGYVGFREYWEAKPQSKIIKVAADGGGAEVVFEESAWIGHVNTSPTRPELLSFCHEGPWDRVDQRIWGLNLTTGAVWKIRPTEPGEAVGHEYWLADGETIGYHGQTAGGPVYGTVRYDDTDREEIPFPKGSTHFHSNDRDLIVGDGSPRDPYVYLWRREGSGFGEPRRLCTHRSSFHIQKTHVHPRFSPDGRFVLFTSDRLGYGNMYLVELPEFESLPLSK